MYYFQGSADPLGASDLINVICGKKFCQGHWWNSSNFCIKYINVCQESIRFHFRQCPWQKLFPHITLIRSDTDFTKWMNCKCIIYSFGMILFWVGASQMAFDKFYLVFNTYVLKEVIYLKRSLQNHQFSWQNVLNNLSPSVYLDLFAPHNTENILAPYFVI